MSMEDMSGFEKLCGLHGRYDGEKTARTRKTRRAERSGKLAGSLEQAILDSGLKNGMTISFHHHFRNGDRVVNMVVDTLARMGYRDLVLAASSLTDCHAPLIRHIKDGVIRRIETSGLRGELAEEVSRGLMDLPVVFRSHGGRAYAIESGELHIDVAFLGAPACDVFGNASGAVSDDEESEAVMCGSLGYAMVDARYADHTIILTDCIVPYPNIPFAIPESDVDAVVKTSEIGDPKGIMSGATRFTKNPKELLLAESCADIIQACGLLRDGFNMQLGSGGAALAVARFLREKMLRDNIRARCAFGGITGQISEMYQEGLIYRIMDVQSFDLKAAASVKSNRFHSQMSASQYASPRSFAAVDMLDFVVLSALEVDTDFNVNVLTGSDGVIRGAVGGHPDTAAGARVSIVVTPLIRGRIACVTDRVATVVTPGETVDIVVTERGAAVNPRRPELLEQLKAAGIRTCGIHELRDMAYEMTGVPDPIEYTDKVVGVVAYRDNSVIDRIYQVK